MNLADRLFMWALLVLITILSYGLYKQKLETAKLKSVIERWQKEELQEEREQEEREREWMEQEEFLVSHTW